MPPVAINSTNMKRLVALATHYFSALMTFGGPECGLQTRSRWGSEWFNSIFEATHFPASFSVNDRLLVRIRKLQRNTFQTMLVLCTTYGPLGLSFCTVLGSIVVSIPACHAGDQGVKYLWIYIFEYRSLKIDLYINSNRIIQLFEYIAFSTYIKGIPCIPIYIYLYIIYIPQR